MILATSLWALLFVLMLWLPQNTQHEGAHCLAHKRYGAEITAFVPYPTGQDNTFSVKFWAAGFTWAHMQYKQPHDRPLLGRERAITAIAPQATNTVILAALAGLYVALGSLPAILVALYITNYLDGMWNLGTYYKPEPERKYTDGWKFQEALGLNKWTCRVGAACWHVGFAVPFVI